MLFIPIITTNLHLCAALNGGAYPQIESQPTYLVIEGGEVNRIVTHAELSKIPHVETTTRKIHFVMK